MMGFLFSTRVGSPKSENLYTEIVFLTLRFIVMTGKHNFIIFIIIYIKLFLIKNITYQYLNKHYIFVF